MIKVRDGCQSLICTARNYIHCFKVKIVRFHVTGLIKTSRLRLGLLHQDIGTSVKLQSSKACMVAQLNTSASKSLAAF